MLADKKKMADMDDATIEKRRLDLLEKLFIEQHPVTIVDALEIDQHVAFIMSEEAAAQIRRGLTHPERLKYESTALVKVKLAAQTADGDKIVYLVEHFQFENVGNEDGVLSVERERLHFGEIEVHSHVFARPDYLGEVDFGDLIAALEGPAWVNPQIKQISSAQRVFGILSIYNHHVAQLQFYSHDLRDKLTAWNNYGLKKFGLPISIVNAF